MEGEDQSNGKAVLGMLCGTQVRYYLMSTFDMDFV